MRLYTVKIVANILDCSTKTVRRAINAGHLKVVRLGESAKSDRVHPDELDIFIRNRSRTCHSTSGANIGGFLSVSPVN